MKTDHIRPAVGLRFEVGPGAAIHSPLATRNGFLHFLLRGCDLELFTSVLNGLGPFLEDEEIPVVVPMQIELLHCSITLKVRGAFLVFTLDFVRQGILAVTAIISSLAAVQCGEDQVSKCSLAFFVKVIVIHKMCVAIKTFWI